MNIAFFDFDGTITHEDAFTKFIFYATPQHRLIAGMVLLSPVILLHKLGLYPAAKIRPLLAKFAFCNRSEPQIFELGARFAADYLPSVLRPTAMEKISWHKARGDKVVVVSASLNPYLSYWCKTHDLDLICSELESKSSLLTGNYVQGDCGGDNKVRFINQRFDLTLFDIIFAYGDTAEDHPMLELAHTKYYQWREVA
ncbi:HAD-IB family phosphatase [Moritella sp. Urea-trap-13]|uniref:HAD-IB family phosphatase n=1 Tax=Moritella sp. Urea-trap-13 TaxID=2058327 RepID=UPI000C31D8CC|nr:HAD-IB family phosphatase [Moritella sp. Urea-trap-13]PKH08041.1 phosphoserine phosphatase [Moritella sp. Urea-trap-13]